MRISHNTFFDLGVGSINNQLASLVRTQQQAATGRRILTPADDPVASAAVVELDRSLNTTNQYLENIGNARSTLSLEESVVANIGRVLQEARQTVVSAGNAALSSSDRATLATTLRSNYNELLGLANSQDGQGNYLFSGFATDTKPFTQGSGAAVYAGDQGQRKLQITPSRQIEISDSGQDLFRPGVAGQDVFATIENFITALTNGTSNAPVTTATASVAGTITTSVAPNAVTPVAAVTLTYSTTGPALTTSSADPAFNGLTFDNLSTPPFTLGQAITVNGVSFTIGGTPVDGDTFTINPSPIATALRELDNAQSNALRVQTNIGSRLNELDSTQITDDDAALQYEQALSNLRDVDLVKALTDLTRLQTSLEAAQRSFVNIQGLSLFNYL